jgi:hypothetical protein
MLEAERQALYVARRGLQCPIETCQSIMAFPESDFRHEIAGVIVQDMECPACGCRWIDVYRLVGFEERCV